MLLFEVLLCQYIKLEVWSALRTATSIRLMILLAWLGSASVGVTSDKFGRRKAIAFGCVWGVIGGALMAGAAHVAMRM